MGLPSGYKRLAYIIGSNSAYSIISGLHLTDADEVRAEVYITGNCNVYGCYTGSSAGDNFSLYVGSTYYARMDGKVVSNVSSSKNARLALVHNKDGLWINGTKRITFTDVGTFTAGTNFYIGWLDNASSAKVIGRIYRLEVVGKFVGIPALRVSDGVCGLYDTLNGTFYASNGTAWAGVLADETERSLQARRRLMMYPYIPGLIILPPGYTRYDYIQGDGTAYIDTTINTAEEQALEVIVNYLATSKNNAKFIGADLVNAGRFRIGGWGVFAGRIGGWYHNGSSNAYTDDAKGIKSQITFQGSNGAQTLTVKQGGAIVRQRTDTKAYVSGYASHILVGSNPDAKIYEALVYSDYDATALVFRGIPCTDPNGVPGMYDLVSRTFFSNAAGSGALSVGFD